MSINNYYNRYKSIELTEYSTTLSDMIKMEFANIVEDIDIRIPDCREKSIAITKIDEAVMWANKAIAVTQEEG